MEKFLFKGFKIFNGKEFIKDDCLLVEDGKIAKIGTGLECADAEVVEGNGRLLTPGFIDLHAHFRDPGLEWNEDLKSGAMAGAAGGFTTLVAMPNTKPAVSEPALVEYVLSHGAAAKAARILPAGCVARSARARKSARWKRWRRPERYSSPTTVHPSRRATFCASLCSTPASVCRASWSTRRR